ncbi:MAG: hypothetical protein ACYS15_04665 [Planctomycetota bacterium]|jgi:hypothetical protein
MNRMCAWAGAAVAAAAVGPALGLLAGRLAGPPAPCAQPPANCQLPDQLGHGAGNTTGAASDANPESGYAVHDNFALDSAGIVNALCWWGFYLDLAGQADCGPGGAPDVFTVTYYFNEPGFPGEPSGIKAGPFDLTATLTKAETGNLIPSAFGDLVEYGYTATHPAVSVAAGECVWIEIQNDTTGSDPSCVWYWSTAPSAAEGGLGDAVSWQFGATTPLNDFDHAFCLNEPLGDPTACELPVNPGCSGAVNPCDQESPGPGCADPECCSLICVDLPFCCVSSWNEQCVEVARVICTDCGKVGTGDCFEANFTPFCDDTCGDLPCIGCCQTVCAVDPLCCGDGPPPAAWDGFCAFEAMQLCGCLPGAEPVNDDCADAIPIGLGDTPLDNDCATAGGPSHAECNDGFLVGLGLDIWYTYTADFTGQLLVSTCDQVDYDTQLAVYEGCDCELLSDPPLGCNDDGAVCANGTSLVVVDVTAGNCYTIRVGSSFAGPTGTGTLTLSTEVPEPCSIDADIPPDALPEGEVCGENTNGGCDNAPAPPAFTPIQIGDAVHGTAWASGGIRDTDWYELVVTEEVTVTVTVKAEFPFALGFAETFTPGSGDCADATGSIVPSASAPDCEVAWVTLTLSPGTWWPWVAPNIGDGLPCPEGTTAGNDYLLTIGTDIPCPWDCQTTPDGIVNVTDFLKLLAEWGQVGTPCDFDGGGVAVTDFLDLLANWGPCP